MKLYAFTVSIDAKLSTLLEAMEMKKCLLVSMELKSDCYLVSYRSEVMLHGFPYEL